MPRPEHRSWLIRSCGLGIIVHLLRFAVGADLGHLVVLVRDEKDVVGLEVTVDDANLVSLAHRTGYVGEDGGRGFWGEAALPLEAFSRRINRR